MVVMNKDRELIGNEKIEEGLLRLHEDLSDENLAAVLTTIRKRKEEGGHFVVAVTASDAGMTLRPLKLSNGKKYFAAFTSFEEELKGEDKIMSGFTASIEQLFGICLKSEEIDGIILNPWDKELKLDKNLIEIV
ncbi:MAG: SseB family protein [Lachnospiraceae bacterium]|nr:SseB family protein [Lachnospiraceae bacterium]